MTAAPGIQLIDNLTAAATPDGTEIMYAEQGGAAKKITVAQIRAGRATLAGTETLTNKTLTAPAINGGTLDGTQTITSQSGFRTALGLGTIATQAASAVTITGGAITGITDLAVADGGTGASNASGARTNLGLAIGTDVQAYDAGLASIAGLTTAADKMIYTTALDVYATADLTSVARTLLAQTTQALMRTTGLGLGTIATQAASSVAITGGTINGTIIGGSTPAAITGTTGTLTGALSVGTGLANSFQFLGAASASAPVINITGSDTDVSGIYAAKGAGLHGFYNAGGSTFLAQIGATGLNLASGLGLLVNSVKVVGARDTGWTAMTGTPDKSTSYATGSVTLAQLAGRVMALQTALTTHGLIGT